MKNKCENNLELERGGNSLNGIKNSSFNQKSVVDPTLL